MNSFHSKFHLIIHYFISLHLYRKVLNRQVNSKFKWKIDYIFYYHQHFNANSKVIPKAYE